MIMEQIGLRIKQLRDSLNASQDLFAERIGKHKQTLSKYERGTLTPPNKILERICAEFSVRMEWLLLGSGNMYKTEQPAHMVMSDNAAPPYEAGDFVNIPLNSGRISAGGGLIAESFIDMRVAFRRDWLLRKGDPEKMSIIRVQGDSMVPTLQGGDIVLVDHGRNYVDPQGGIYAIASGDHIMIKRLQLIHPSGMLRIISDNEKYEPIETDPGKVIINGRVIWFGREL
jgi:phage repressor protein C with HTH and peptisase S24 domain